MTPEQLLDILEREVEIQLANLRDIGSEFEDSARAVAIYAAERATHLSTLTAEVGFGMAVTAESHNVALMAANKAADVGDQIDAAARERFAAIMASGLRIVATALAAA